jgi:hypothetical protein
MVMHLASGNVETKSVRNSHFRRLIAYCVERKKYFLQMNYEKRETKQPRDILRCCPSICLERMGRINKNLPKKSCF